MLETIMVDSWEAMWEEWSSESMVGMLVAL